MPIENRIKKAVKSTYQGISSVSIETENVQKAILECHLPKIIQSFLLFLVAWLLRKKSPMTFLIMFLGSAAPLFISQNSQVEYFIESLFGAESVLAQLLIFIIRIYTSGIDYFVFSCFAIIAIILAWSEVQKYRVRKELNQIISAITFTPESNWFEKKCENAIHKLGDRYSENNNFKNPRLSNIYKALIWPEHWVDNFRNSLKNFVIEADKFYSSISEEYKQEYSIVNKNVDIIIDIFNTRDEKRLSRIFDLVEEIMHLLQTLSFIDVQYRYSFNRLSDISKIMYEYQPMCEYISKHVVYIKGLAGTGKSHLIADIVKERMNLGYKSLLVLGLDFQDNTNPKDRVLNILGVKGTWDDFLSQLNRIGQLEGHGVVIFIDGVNEGAGYKLWEHQLADIETDILRYDYLSLVVSARTFMENNILDSISKGKASINLSGFKGMEDEAITYLTGKFGVTIPNITSLKDFSNPLFLKLYCSTYTDDSLPKPNSFLDVADNYLKKINERLAVKYEYESSMFNYVHDAVYLLADMFVKENGRKNKYKSLSDFLFLLQNVLPSGIDCNRFVQDMASEGILMCYQGVNGNILVDFNFEIIGDYICAYTLLKSGYTQYNETIYENGVYEATAVLMPLVIGEEIFNNISIDMSQKYKENLFLYTLNQRFTLSKFALDKLDWLRKNMPTIFYEYVPNIVMFEECLDIVESFNEDLKSMTMIERDTAYGFYYTITTYDIDSSYIMLLAKWATSISRKSSMQLSEKQAYQTATILCWALSIPYEKLRNYATKAIINLLRDKPSVVMKLVELFDDVNDPYIQQRLYSVVHGCVFRGDCIYSVDLAILVYQKVFDKDTIRTDILLRDYARCAIDMIKQNVPVENISFEKINPPYKSKFNMDMCPNRDTIESKYRLEYDNGFSNEVVTTQNAILDSMETEYSNDIGGYGDFGRYVFESATDKWGQDASLLRNYAIQLIFEKYGYDAKKYASHDFQYRRGRGDKIKIERYGKKYQWIAMYDVLGLLSDNYSMISSLNCNKDECYQGTWNPHVRNIDPTNSYCYYDSGDDDYRGETLEWVINKKIPFQIKKPKMWLKSKEGNFSDVIKRTVEVTDEKGDVWTVLYGYNTLIQDNDKISLSDEDCGLWVFVQAYLCKHADWNNLQKAIYKIGTKGRNLPEYMNPFYKLFYKDYYKSLSYKDFAKKEQLDEWHEFKGKRSDYQISYIPYSSEEEVSILRLNHLLFDILKLKDGERDGEYVDEQNNLIAFDPSANYKNSGQLLVRKDKLIIALKENGLSLVWPVLCERQCGIGLIGNQIGGVAYYNSQFKIKVRLRHYIDKPYDSKRVKCMSKIKNRIKKIWYKVSFKKSKTLKTKLWYLSQSDSMDDDFFDFEE